MKIEFMITFSKKFVEILLKDFIDNMLLFSPSKLIIIYLHIWYSCGSRSKSAQTGNLYTDYLPQYGEHVSLSVIQEDGQSELLVVGQDCGSLGKVGSKIKKKKTTFSGLLSVSCELVKMDIMLYILV